MTLITAWLEIENSRLPDCISSMLFSVDNSSHSWPRIALERTDPSDERPPIAHSSESTALVRFELPADMECAHGEAPREIGSVGSIVGSAPPESSSGRPLVTVAVPCLPSVFANEIFFSDERNQREFESTVKRLLAGRGEWIRTNVTTDVANGNPTPDFGSVPQPTGTRARAAENYERLAAAVATTLLLARAEIGGARIVTFDTGSVALLRQLVSGDPSVSKRKTLETDAKELVKQLLAAARKHDLKPGTAPKTMPPEASFGLQLAGLIEAELNVEDEPGSAQLAWLPKSRDRGESGPKSVDDALLGHILTGLIDSIKFPSISRVEEIIRSAEQRLASEASEHAEAYDQAAEALSIVLQNVENAEQRLDHHFVERFRNLPALVGAAYAFCGWSSNPLQNFEQRVQRLKETLPAAHQAAWTLFAAAAGSGRLRPAYLRSRLWMAAYRTTWALHLSNAQGVKSQHTEKLAWNIMHGDVEMKETGPFLEASVGEFEIPIGLQIIDRRVVVRKRAEELLVVPEEAGKTADAILAAVDGDLSDFTLDLKKLIRRDLTIQLARDVAGRSSGSTITFENLGEKDLTIALRWDDAEQAADKLSRGQALDRILEGLSDSKLKDLCSELTDAGPATSG